MDDKNLDELANQLLIVASEKLEKLRASRRIVPMQQIVYAIKTIHEIKQAGGKIEEKGEFFEYLRENKDKAVK